LFSEKGFQQIVPDVGGFLFGSVDRVALIECNGAADVIKHSDLAAQCNFEFLETARLSVRVASGFDHGLMGILNGLDVFLEPLFQHFRFAGFHGVTGKTKQNFGNVDVRFCADDGIRRATQLVTFSLKTFEPFVVWSLEGSRANNGAGTDGHNANNEKQSVDCSHGVLTVYLFKRRSSVLARSRA
jgi:hypothetical protein